MAHPSTRCWSCRHTLAIGQERCPECGEGRVAELTPAFTADYSRARTLLDGASLLLGPQDSSGPQGGLAMMGYVFNASANHRPLRVKAGRAAEAARLLDEHGITVTGGGTVVDISESNCPMCGAALPNDRAAGSDGTCGGCGTPFTWIDVRT